MTLEILKEGMLVLIEWIGWVIVYAIITLPILYAIGNAVCDYLLELKRRDLEEDEEHI